MSYLVYIVHKLAGMKAIQNPQNLKTICSVDASLGSTKITKEMCTRQL